MTVKVGDLVRVIKIPPGLPQDSQKVWETAFRRCFAVADIEESGAIEVEVSRLEEQLGDGGIGYTIECIYPAEGEYELCQGPS